jgi:hypothetical protein
VKNGAIVEKVGVRVIAMEFDNFGDEATSRTAFDVNNDV